MMIDTKYIKNKVLKIALSGKIVSQDLNDFSISKLITMICNETGVKHSPILNNIPFEIPDNWEWIKLSTIAKKITAGGDKPQVFSKIKTQNIKIPIYSNGLVNNGLYGYTDKASVFEDSITISARGTIGNPVIRTEPYLPIVRLITVLPTSFVDIKYLHLALSFLVGTGEGTTTAQLTVPKVSELLIPLPPKSEQVQIISKVDKIFSLIMEIDNNQSDVLYITEQIRNKLLKYGIQGKLSKRLDSDGDAKALVSKQTIIPKRKIPFELPKNWIWVKLSDISKILNGDRGKNYPAKRYWVQEGIPFINAGCLVGKNLDDKFFNYITKERYELLNAGFIEIFDLLYCLRGSLGKLSINSKFDQGAIASSLCIIRPLENVDVEYLYYALSGEHGLYLINNARSGTAQPNLSARNIKEYLIPLPPMAEQKRIVVRINKTFQILDSLIM